jgi:hypothetical protein
MGSKPNYGIDRPDIVAFFVLVGIVSLILAAVSFLGLATALLTSLVSFGVAASFIVGSKTVKGSVAKKLDDSAMSIPREVGLKCSVRIL